MAVTKETYTLNAGFTRDNVATALREAFIDAGLMTEWYDSFNVSSDRAFRVLQIQHDSTKTYGTSFYVFAISNTAISVSLATNGWKTTGAAPINIPAGTQYLDWHRLPTDTAPTDAQGSSTILSWSTTSNLFLDRFTSGDDTKQSWFVFRQPSTLGKSVPFTILHKDTVLHPWLDLTKGCISGYVTARATVQPGGTDRRAGHVLFQTQENLRRCLSIGGMLRGIASSSGNATYHGVGLNNYSYYGAGSVSNDFQSNSGFYAYNFGGGGSSVGAGVPLPVGRNYNNSEYTTDYVPICTNLPWSFWTPTRLANDFGIYMHYAANDIALGDRFIVQSAINEWEVLNFANNTVVTDGASATFLARIV